jgi:hypothetical protein
MSLSNYASTCFSLAQELAASLTPEDARELAADLTTLGQAGWNSWLLDHAHDVADYVAATPSRRSSRKAWRDPQFRRRLTLGAWLRCRESGGLLRVIARNEIWLTPGGSYRDMAAKAADVYWDILMEEVPEWPFAECFSLRR